MTDDIDVKQYRPGEEVEPDSVVYLEGQASGAYPRGTRVRKVGTNDDDAHPDGSLATVVSSLGPVNVPEHPEVTYFYFVIFDETPGLPIGIADYRLELVES